MKNTLKNKIAKGLIVVGLGIPVLSFGGAITYTTIDSIVDHRMRSSTQLNRLYMVEREIKKQETKKEPMNQFERDRYIIWKEEYTALKDDVSLMKEKKAYESRKDRFSYNPYLGLLTASSLIPGLLIAIKGARMLVESEEKSNQ